MCSPEGFAVSYEINPWMREHIGDVAPAVALAQWQHLFETLSRAAEIQVMPGDAAWPDLVFTANAGLPLPGGKRFVLSNFKYPQRQGEKHLYRNWLAARGWECIGLPDGVSFEGAGDALADSEGRLWLAHGFRSAPGVAALIAPLWGRPLRSLHLVNPNYYHLDTCFCPLSDGSALYLPEAFDADSRQSLEQAFGEKLMALTPEEGQLFCANAVEANGLVVMNVPPPRLRQALESRGYAVAAAPLTEFIKSGGSAKCLTLRLDA